MRDPIDLGTLGGPNSFAIGINPTGTIVVGESDDGHGQIRPVAWLDGRIIDLGTPAAPGEADGLDVNDRGVIVGAYGQTNDPAATQHAFTWHAGVLRILPGLPGGGGTYARRINAYGEIAGDAFTADGHDHPVLWDARGIRDLGLPPGYTDGYLLALNDEGDTGGAMFAADGSEAAFTWHEGRFQILPTLGGPTAQVNVLDDRGVAGGIADVDTNGTSEAALWGPTATVRGLGFFPGGNFSWILGTNGLGDYTGIASLSATDPFPHVFVAHAGGPLLALPPLSGDYSTNPSIAHGIDRQGDVAGASPTANDNAHATLWIRAFDQAFRPAPAGQTSRPTHDHSPSSEMTKGRDSRSSSWLRP
jgi:probable HAF family extracellular repeat protein